MSPWRKAYTCTHTHRYSLMYMHHTYTITHMHTHVYTLTAIWNLSWRDNEQESPFWTSSGLLSADCWPLSFLISESLSAWQEPSGAAGGQLWRKEHPTFSCCLAAHGPPPAKSSRGSPGKSVRDSVRSLPQAAIPQAGCPSESPRKPIMTRACFQRHSFCWCGTAGWGGLRIMVIC